MGMVSWQFKKFADASSNRWFASTWQDKLAGGFTMSGHPSGDKLSTLQYMITLAMQHGMVWVGQAAKNDGHINRLGSHSGLMTQVSTASSAEEISQADLDSALAYGQRVTAVLARFK